MIAVCMQEYYSQMHVSYTHITKQY